MKDISLKDTTFESEDGSNWKGIVFYRGFKLLLIVETSLENVNVIKRIDILNSSIIGLNGLKIGSKFKDVKHYLSPKIPSYPDGYFGLKDKKYNHITYFFELNNYFNLGVVNVTFGTILEELVIKEILIE